MQNDIQEQAAERPTSREWRLIEKVLDNVVLEQRRARRWGIFFKLLTFFYLFLLIVAVSSGWGDRAAVVAEPHTAMIEVRGLIHADEHASADNLVTALRAAFEAPQAKGIVLRINSPGGSPVQAGYVYDEIRRLKAKYPDKKVYAVIADIGASGAYYIAAAADEIYADKASLVGSIGVIASGFGFVRAMEKLGIERRVYTAGENKNFLDPFLPEDSEDVVYWQKVLETTHRQFIEQVKQGRGDRLGDHPELFSGLIWSGEQAVEMGLIDGLGSSSYVARELIGAEKLVDYTPSRSPFEELVRELGTRVGQGIGSMLMSGTFNLR